MAIALALKRYASPVFAVLIGVLLFLAATVPSADRFRSEIIQPASRVLIAEKATSDLLGVMGDIEHKLFPIWGYVLDAAHKYDATALHDDLLEHSDTMNFQVGAYFKIEYPGCFSDYLGMGGMFINLVDGCEVEKYRSAEK